jgi:two-component system phosphate regulon response regulator OmpR
MNAPRKTLLIIDDDERLCSLLATFLARHGYELLSAGNGELGLKLIRDRRPQLVILDLMLPGRDGFEICREIRKHSRIPVIMLTARGDITDRVVGLELGADDYLPKPFEPRELVARIQSILRRTEPGAATEKLALGDLELDPSARSFRLRGKSVELSTTEFDLLELFLRNPGRVLTRDWIMDQLRGRDWEAFDRSIDIAVSRLRAKIEDDARTPRYLKTIRKKGYLLAGEEP